MEIKVEAGDIAQSPAKAIIVNLFEGVTTPAGGTGAVDKALDGGISALIKEGEIKGKGGEMTVVHSLGKIASPRVIVAGLGKQPDFGYKQIKDLIGTALRRVRAAGGTSAATIVHGAGIAGLDPEQSGQAIAEGAVMGSYRFRRYKSAAAGKDGEESNLPEIETLTIVEQDKSKLRALQRGVERGTILGTAANHTRDLANEPANALPPVVFAERARALAKDADLECEILNDGQLKQMGMGALLGVGIGSAQPPRFIIIKYEGDKRSKKTLGLLGKGITFDSGGSASSRRRGWRR